MNFNEIEKYKVRVSFGRKLSLCYDFARNEAHLPVAEKTRSIKKQSCGPSR